MLALLQSLVTATADRFRVAVRSALRSVILLSLAAMLVFAGVIALVTGIYQSLAPTLGHWQAGAIVALGLLLPAFLLVVVARAGEPRASAPPPSAPRRAAGTSESTPDDDAVAAELGASAGRLLRRYRPQTLDIVLGAFVAGLLLSRGQRNRDEAADDDGRPSD